MYICDECGESFVKFQDKANHVRWNHVEMTQEKKLRLSEGARKSNNKRFGKYISEKTECSKDGCYNQIEIQYREGRRNNKYYCSVSCRNSRGKMSDKTKKIISERISSLWKEGKFDNIMINNNRVFSSKNERLITDYFKKNFNNDGWKSGGIIKYKDTRLSRDMYSDKLKICFEYDGIWHFKDIHGQLEDKKKKDLYLELWCIENNYRLIRLQDEFFENVDQVYNLLYNTKENIIKVGDKY
jgi:hypothetical protein